MLDSGRERYNPYHCLTKKRIMEPQNYKNHIRYYAPHHFVLYPLAMAMGIFSFYCSFKYPEQKVIWWFLTALMCFIVFVAFLMRQHYGLINQNRTVRLEVRFRYYVLTNTRFESFEHQLTNGQIYALRFASDEELPALVKRTLAENLSPKEIKQAIVNWLPDYMRV